MISEDLILKILRDNSGGVKMTKLVVEVIDPPADFVGDFPSSFLCSLTDKLEEMQKSGKLGLLNYAYPMGGGCVREKTFVYLPL